MADASRRVPLLRSGLSPSGSRTTEAAMAVDTPLIALSNEQLDNFRWMQRLAQHDLSQLQTLEPYVVELFPAKSNADDSWALVAILRDIPNTLNGLDRLKDSVGLEPQCPLVLIHSTRIVWPSMVSTDDSESEVSFDHAKQAAAALIADIAGDPVLSLGVTFVGASTMRARRTPFDREQCGNSVLVYVKALGWRPFGSSRLPERVPVGDSLVPVDILEGWFHPHGLQKELQSCNATLGVGGSIMSTERNGLGTLGMFARRGQTVGFITAAHVVHNESLEQKDAMFTNVQHPSSEDGSKWRTGTKVVGSVNRWIRPLDDITHPLETATFIFPPAGGSANGDVAFVPLSDQAGSFEQKIGCSQEALNMSYLERIAKVTDYEFPTVCFCGHVGDMQEGREVYKVGRTSGLTIGTVKSICGVTYFHLDGLGEAIAWFQNLSNMTLPEFIMSRLKSTYSIKNISMVAVSNDFTFTMKGDSGAMVFQLLDDVSVSPCRAAPVGLLIGHHTDSTGAASGVVCSLRPLLIELGVTFEKPRTCTHGLQS